MHPNQVFIDQVQLKGLGDQFDHAQRRPWSVRLLSGLFGEQRAKL
jgi:hypothetical protein